LADYLITGCGGFVSWHYLQHLAQTDFQGQIVGIGTTAPTGVPESLRFRFEETNLLDSEELSALLSRVRPQFCIHLAAMSSVAGSWVQPDKSFVNNTNIFLNLVEAIRKCSPETRVLSIGSSEQYGTQKDPAAPLTEGDPLNPRSPYAVARCAQEWLGKAYIAGYGMDIVMTRSFNHVGVHQNRRFVLSGFARMFAESLVKKNRVVPLTAGNLDIIRDFLDVRDVITAYEVVLRQATTGAIYNVCSGQGLRLFEAVKYLSSASGLRYDVALDKSLVRSVETPIVIGSREAITTQFGWRPVHTLQQSLADLLEHWVNVLRQ
jgi:GDP-4-dehydro-6-deoxy-D-mannose reductase